MFFGNVLQKVLENQIGNKALAISKSISFMPEIINLVEKNDPNHELQKIITTIQQSIDAEFIVIGDENGIRFSHPNKKLIGEHMVGEDNNILRPTVVPRPGRLLCRLSRPLRLQVTRCSRIPATSPESSRRQRVEKAAFGGNVPDEEWHQYGRTPYGQRFSPLTDITPTMSDRFRSRGSTRRET